MATRRWRMRHLEHGSGVEHLRASRGGQMDAAADTRNTKDVHHRQFAGQSRHINTRRRWAHHGQDLVLRQPGLAHNLELLQLIDAPHDPHLPALLVQHVRGRALDLPCRDPILIARVRPQVVVAGDEIVFAASLGAMLVPHALGKVLVRGACREQRGSGLVSTRCRKSSTHRPSRPSLGRIPPRCLRSSSESGTWNCRQTMQQAHPWRRSTFSARAKHL